MNTILLQKILDLLKDNLTGVGTFIKSVFVHDPQDNQILSYDAEIGKWVNKDATEVELDLTNTFEAQPIATLPDSANNVPMKSLSVNIVPKETGTGTKSPSNPYTISGTDTVTITKCGKNLWSGTASPTGTYRSSAIDFFLPAGEYVFSATVTSSDTDGTKSLILLRNVDNGAEYVRLDRNTRSSFAITFTKDIVSIQFFAGYNDAQSAGDTYTFADLQIEKDTSTATAYEPYTATTYTIALGQTVYCGVCDVTGGQSKVTQDFITLDGTETWTQSGAAFRTYQTLPSADTTAGRKPVSCNIGNYLAAGTAENACWLASGWFYFCAPSTVTTEAEMAQWVSDHNIQVAYPLATPTALSTTPTAIKTTGYDNVSADCGDVSGEYYTKTAESILALANITEDITSSITKNTTDFSDILLKVSQNNKVISIEIYSASTSSALIGTFLSNLPKPAMNSKVLLANTTIGEDGIIIGTLKTTGELEITTTGAKSFSGLITYVSK